MSLLSMTYQCIASGPAHLVLGCFCRGNPPSIVHRVDVIGISCYTSTDLVHWQNEGVPLICPHALHGSSVACDSPSCMHACMHACMRALRPTLASPGLALAAGQHPDLAPSKVVERPRVLYNDASARFVMWMHVDEADYELARMGVATSAHPEGPFAYHGSFRPHGQMARDFTLFKARAAAPSWHAGTCSHMPPACPRGACMGKHAAQPLHAWACQHVAGVCAALAGFLAPA